MLQRSFELTQERHGATVAPGVRSKVHPVVQLQGLAGNRAVTQLLGGAGAVAPAGKGAKPKKAVPEPIGPVAPRPSDPASQMAAVLSVAQTAPARGEGKCYKGVKAHIKAAGGYGDILDIYKDHRFLPQWYAINFAEQADAYGPEALGLERVGGEPATAEPGTILVLYGGTMNINVPAGDISVIGGRDKAGRIIGYNDGTCHFPPKSAAAALRGMYRPIARPELPAGE